MNRQSGDTLVEVLIATAILGAAVVAGLGIMNYGFGIVLNSIDRTQAQADLTSQISMARYARDAYSVPNVDVSTGAAAEWVELRNAASGATTNVCNATTGAPQPGPNAFHMTLNTTSGTTRDAGAVAFANQPVSNGAVWSEANAVTTPSGVNYIDISVKACWQPSAGTLPEQARSVVRLYAPQ